MTGSRPLHRSTRPSDEPIFTSPTGMDFEKRRIILAPGTVKYSDLTQSLKDKIGPDITEHELLEMIVITMNKIVMHLMAGSDEDITEDDISWP